MNLIKRSLDNIQATDNSSLTAWAAVDTVVVRPSTADPRDRHSRTSHSTAGGGRTATSAANGQVRPRAPPGYRAGRRRCGHRSGGRRETCRPRARRCIALPCKSCGFILPARGSLPVHVWWRAGCLTVSLSRYTCWCRARCLTVSCVLGITPELCPGCPAL